MLIATALNVSSDVEYLDCSGWNAQHQYCQNSFEWYAESLPHTTESEMLSGIVYSVSVPLSGRQ